MTFDEYEKIVWPLAIYPKRGTGDLTYPILGLCGETGEVAEKFKKVLRDGAPKDLIAAELGDVLWYLLACAKELGLTLDDIAQMNAGKLTDRARRGKLHGSGDNR